MKTLRLALLIGMLVLVLSTGTALAHALLLRSDPTADAVLPHSPPLIHLWFSEDLNGSASRIVVWDHRRHDETLGRATLVPGQARQMVAHLRPLPAGSYLVLWTSVSAQDGHLLRGSFVFSVVRRGPLPSLSGVALGGTGQSFPDAPTAASILAHWIELLTAVFWVGAALLSALVFRPAASGVYGPILDRERRLFRRWVAADIVLLMAASTAVLLLLAYGLAGNSWSGALSASNLHSLFADQYSQLWIGRQLIALLGLIITLALTSSPGEASSDAFGAGAPAIAGLVYLYALAASGHGASAAIGVLSGGHIISVSIAADWLHLVGDALWFGGQIAIVLVLIPALFPRREIGSTPLFLDTLDRFSPLAYGSIVVFTLSGIFSAKVHIPSWYAFFHSAYGWTLIVKIALIGLMMLTSTVTVFLLRPRIRRLLPRGGAPFTSLLSMLRINPVLGAGVLLATSVMFYYPVPVGLSPAGPSSYLVQGAGMTGRVKLQPDRAGPNRITVTLRDRSGRPVQGATVAVLTTMLDMVMGTGNARLTEGPAGSYSGNTDLGMGGHWRLQLLVYRPTGLARLYVKVQVGT